MSAPKKNPGRTVLIIEDETFIGMGLRAQLEKLGHKVVGQAATADEGLKMFREHQPNLLLVDIRLAAGDGITLVTQLLKERRVPAIILSAFSDQDLIERATAAGVFGYLIKPVSIESLTAQLEVTLQRFEEHERVLLEKNSLFQTLEERKLVEKAKGIFMKRLNLPEPEAHKKLQQESQKRRVPMIDLARRIIESDEMMGTI